MLPSKLIMFGFGFAPVGLPILSTFPVFVSILKTAIGDICQG
jgi:hypothetical protein